MADHTASLIALREHSGSFAKAWEDRLMENTSCYPPLFFSLSWFVEQPCCDLGPDIYSPPAALF